MSVNWAYDEILSLLLKMLFMTRETVGNYFVLTSVNVVVNIPCSGPSQEERFTHNANIKTKSFRNRTPSMLAKYLTKYYTGFSI